MRRSTVLSLPLQLVFPDLNHSLFISLIEIAPLASAIKLFTLVISSNCTNKPLLRVPYGALLG